MRCVVDTNVLVSAFLWKGAPGRIIELAGAGEIRLYTSRVLLTELSAVLHRKKLANRVRATGYSPEEIAGHYRRLAFRVTARGLRQRASRDVDDDYVLACALAARAHVIVTGSGLAGA